MAVDYFTKWAEAEALANIQDVDVKKFCMEKHSHEIWGAELAYI